MHLQRARVRKARRQPVRPLALLLATILLFSACGAKGGGDTAIIENASAAPAAEAAMDAESEAMSQDMNGVPSEGDAGESSYRGEGAGQASAGFETSSALDLAQHKIIRRAEMEVETESYDDSIALVQRVVTESGGYIEDMQLEGMAPKSAYDAGRRGRIVLRIPAAKLDGVLTQLRKGGQVVYETMQSENVGAQYRDTEAHIKSIDTHLSSLDALMAKATKLEDMLRLEEEISRLRYEKESLESSLRNWDDLVSFSTVTLALRELNSIAPVLETAPEERDFGFGEEAAYNARSAWMGFVGGLRALVLWVLSVWPGLLLLCLLFLLFLFLLRRARRKRPKEDSESAKKSSWSIGLPDKKGKDEKKESSAEDSESEVPR